MSGLNLTPPPERDLPAAEQRRAALVRELRAPRPSRLRRRHILLLPAGLLVTAGAAWAAGVFDAPVKNIYQVDCRAGTQRGAVSATLPNFLSPRVPDSATTVCMQDPTIATGLGYIREGKPRPLVTCRGERKPVVVPGEDAGATCARMDLAALSDETFRRESRRQADAFRLVEPLVRDPFENQDDEAFDCVQAGTLQRDAQRLLDGKGFDDFRVRAGGDDRAAACSAGFAMPIDSDGRTFRVVIDGEKESWAYDEARATLAEPACRRDAQRKGRRRGRPEGMALLIALECLDAKLLLQRQQGLRADEVPAAVRRRFDIRGRTLVVKVAPGRGVPQFHSTAANRRTIRIGFALRPIVAPGPRRTTSR
ncbi:MAG: hypothetical protein ACRDLS_15500 [Solirubrobacteraceae bacterium]